MSLRSEFLADLFGTGRMREIFSDRNRLQKWLDVETALAGAQGGLGVIPAEAASEIASKARAEHLDRAKMATEANETHHIVMAMVHELTRICEGDHGHPADEPRHGLEVEKRWHGSVF